MRDVLFRRCVGTAGFGLTLWPGAARAHLIVTGLGSVYDGAAHFALSPEDYVPIAGAALLAALKGEDHARPAVLILPLAWLCGGLLGWLPDAPAFSSPSWLLFLAVGGLVAADLPLSVGASAAIVGALGLILGYPNGQAMAEYGQGLRGLLGSSAAIFLFVSLITLLATRAPFSWMRIAWRVLGSWIAASGLLLLGWALRRS